jgi:nanoRNase/pAp phosphatase (c-di-AMP/oligoRNAs hydrolase)
MKILNWTDIDLDGIVSHMNIKWAFEGKNITRKHSTAHNFRENILEWLKDNSFEDYDKVYITDIDVSSSYDLIDKPNVTVIDHHESHVENMPEYEHMTNIVYEESSCAKQCYKYFKEEFNTNYTKERKKLILLTDDYDSHALKIKESMYLNIVFWNLNSGSRFDTFIKMFDNGFKGWTAQQKSIIDIHYKELEILLEKLEIFEADIKLHGKKRKVMSTFARTKINDVAVHLLDQGAEIAIVVNPRTKHVSFRANKDNTEVELDKLSAKIADGGGHKTSSGGQITDDFLKFTKLFKPIS